MGEIVTTEELRNMRALRGHFGALSGSYLEKARVPSGLEAPNQVPVQSRADYV
jgi:hypothetical protein